MKTPPEEYVCPYCDGEDTNTDDFSATVCDLWTLYALPGHVRWDEAKKYLRSSMEAGVSEATGYPDPFGKKKRKKKVRS
jgi:hypothetical protein